MSYIYVKVVLHDWVFFVSDVKRILRIYWENLWRPSLMMTRFCRLNMWYRIFALNWRQVLEKKLHHSCKPTFTLRDFVRSSWVWNFGCIQNKYHRHEIRDELNAPVTVHVYSGKHVVVLKVILHFIDSHGDMIFKYLLVNPGFHAWKRGSTTVWYNATEWLIQKTKKNILI